MLAIFGMGLHELLILSIVLLLVLGFVGVVVGGVFLAVYVARKKG